MVRWTITIMYFLTIIVIFLNTHPYRIYTYIIYVYSSMYIYIYTVYIKNYIKQLVTRKKDH